MKIHFQIKSAIKLINRAGLKRTMYNCGLKPNVFTWTWFEAPCISWCCTSRHPSWSQLSPLSLSVSALRLFCYYFFPSADHRDIARKGSSSMCFPLSCHFLIVFKPHPCRKRERARETGERARERDPWPSPGCLKKLTQDNSSEWALN